MRATDLGFRARGPPGCMIMFCYFFNHTYDCEERNRYWRSGCRRSFSDRYMSGSSTHVQILPCIFGTILSKGKECGPVKTVLDLRAIFHKPRRKGFRPQVYHGNCRSDFKTPEPLHQTGYLFLGGTVDTWHMPFKLLSFREASSAYLLSLPVLLSKEHGQQESLGVLLGHVSKQALHSRFLKGVKQHDRWSRRVPGDCVQVSEHIRMAGVSECSGFRSCIA